MEKFNVPEVEQPPRQEQNGGGRSGNTNVDSSGFGLVNWLFDHVDDRSPIFMRLYRHYDESVKLHSEYRWLAIPLCVLCVTLDFFVFALYAAAAAIIVGITFIFVKGTGILEFFFPTGL